MAYRVRVSKAALEEAENAYVWMKEKYSEATATKWYNGLVDAVHSLKEMPERCPYAPEGADIGKAIRHLLYGKRNAVYRIIFAVEYDEALDEEVVRIFRIWHGARDHIQASDLAEDE